jgi:hypothetical protein
VLAAAQGAYEAGDLETGFELALAAQTICQDAQQQLRYMSAVFLARKIEAEMHPEWPTLRIINYSDQKLCAVFFDGETITWGSNVTWLGTDVTPLESGEAARWKLPPGTYTIRLYDCKIQQVGEAKDVVITQSKTLNFGTPDSEGWVCDGSAQDIVNTAVASYQNGDFEEADHLALLAERICTDGTRRARLGVLRWYLDQQLHPEWPSVQVISLFQEPVCGLALGNMNAESTLPVPSVLGTNQLEFLQTVSFRAAPGIYALGAFDCQSQRIASANNIRVDQDTVLSIGPKGVQVVPILDSSSLSGTSATATTTPKTLPLPTASPN